MRKNYKNTDLAQTIANRYCSTCETGSNPVDCKATGCVLHHLVHFAIWGYVTTKNERCKECLANDGDMFGCGAEDDFGLCLKKASKKILEGKEIYD